MALPDGARSARGCRLSRRAGPAPGDPGPVGQRQDHAVPCAGRPVAVRPGHGPHTRGCAQSCSCRRSPICPIGTLREALCYPDKPGRPQRRRDRRGADACAARPSRRPAGRERQLVDGRCRRASSSGCPSPARCWSSPTGCSSTRRARPWTRRPRRTMYRLLAERLPGVDHGQHRAQAQRRRVPRPPARAGPGAAGGSRMTDLAPAGG